MPHSKQRLMSCVHSGLLCRYGGDTSSFRRAEAPQRCALVAVYTTLTTTFWPSAGARRCPDADVAAHAFPRICCRVAVVSHRQRLTARRRFTALLTALPLRSTSRGLPSVHAFIRANAHARQFSVVPWLFLHETSRAFGASAGQRAQPCGAASNKRDS
jgi:hypothetical protein